MKKDHLKDTIKNDNTVLPTNDSFIASPPKNELILLNGAEPPSNCAESRQISRR